LSEPLTHFDDAGASRMVDVGGKVVTYRRAVASGLVRMEPNTLQTIENRGISKGNVYEVARLAGIQAAKRTWELIPLCHLLPLEKVEIGFETVDERTLRIVATVSTHAKTGVEMEGLTAVTVAALTVYDMCKAIDRGIVIGPFQLEQKSGGKSGEFSRGG
jgi:cyclic pyranopterin monophosphate synthase